MNGYYYYYIVWRMESQTVMRLVIMAHQTCYHLKQGTRAPAGLINRNFMTQ